ncbi:hypothetical protein ACFWY5_39135 [Nonomuraea sp. NPDC059007]|uniref:hypothetical protein n=1 Tax=Nonomuraea sp. NPDC059007 TaxID=3346692 RepID=UPI0036BDAF9B
MSAANERLDIPAGGGDRSSLSLTAWESRAKRCERAAHQDLVAEKRASASQNASRRKPTSLLRTVIQFDLVEGEAGDRLHRHQAIVIMEVLECLAARNVLHPSLSTTSEPDPEGELPA